MCNSRKRKTAEQRSGKQFYKVQTGKGSGSSTVKTNSKIIEKTAKTNSKKAVSVIIL